MLGNPRDHGIQVAMLAPQSVQPAEQIVFIGQHARSIIVIYAIRKPEFYAPVPG
jgi:hypothetical protein